MNTKIQLKPKHSIAQLEEAVKSSQDEKQKTRLRVLIKLKKGSSKSAVARDFVTTRATIIYWVKIYNQKGIEALSLSKGGRPEGNPVWETKIFDDLVEEINKQEQCWSVPLMVEWIRKEKEESIPESTIAYHLKLKKISYKSLRPHPYRGDREKQELFKKKG